jgi:hypothetical protein
VVTSFSRAGLALAATALVACLTGGCAATANQRPYRFDLPGPVPATTHLLAQRMSSDPELRPTFVDPARGLVLAPWRMIGVSASLTLLPPGEDREFMLERYRAVVQPYGWSSAVLFDVERVLCDVHAFRWDAQNLWGNCRPAPASAPRSTQERIDGKATELAQRRP